MKTTKVTLALVPSSLPEVDELLQKLGVCERELAKVTKTLEARVAEARAAANVVAAPLEEKIAQYTMALKAYATAHRDKLLTGNKKSVVLPGGEFGWRLSPTKVSYGKGGSTMAIQNITKLKLTQYLRYSVEVDREALLRDRPSIAGVKYQQSESFYVKPETGKEPETFPGTPAVKKRA